MRSQFPRFWRFVRRSQPFVGYAKELIVANRYGELLSGFGRVAKRVASGQLRKRARQLGQTRLVDWLSGSHRVDAKFQRLTNHGSVDFKVSIRFPSPVAPILVSVVVPCFNYGRYVREAVQSARTQTLASVEVIVVDDGSTDPETIAVLATLKELPGVRVVRQENQGLPGARNTGILLAQGEYVCCLDADDTIEPSYLEMVIAVLEADRSAGFAFTWVQFFGDENRVWHTHEFSIDEAILSNQTAVSAVFRRDDWLAVGGYRPDMRDGYEDWDFWLRIAALGRRGRVFRVPLFNHRRHGRTMTHEADSKRHNLRARMQESNPRIFSDARVRQQLQRLSVPVGSADPFALLRRAGVFRRPDSKPHLLVLAPWLADGGAEILLLDVLTMMRGDLRMTIVTSIADQQPTWSQFRRITSDIVALDGAFGEDRWPALVDHLIMSRDTRVVLSHGSAFAYQVLAGLKQRHPHLRSIDILHNDLPGGHIRGAIAASSNIDCHVAVSERVAASLRRLGAEPSRIVTIPNGVDIELVFNPKRQNRLEARRRLGLSEQAFVVAFVGRLSEEKRPLAFLDCLAELTGTIFCQAVMVGAGPLESEVESAILRRGLRDKIARLPQVERSEIGAIYAAADLLVSTSSVEGLPFTVLEAMATGCPVAATDVGDLARLIKPGENGFLVPADAPERLVPILAELSRDSELQARMRSAARFTVEQSSFTLTAMRIAYSRLLNNLAGVDHAASTQSSPSMR